jgi:hypothetical protein
VQGVQGDVQECGRGQDGRVKIFSLSRLTG